MTGFQNPTGNVFYRVNEGSILEQELRALGWEEVSPDLAKENDYLAVPELSQIGIPFLTSAKFDDLISLLKEAKAAGWGDPGSGSVDPEAIPARATFPKEDTSAGTEASGGAQSLSDLTVKQLQAKAQELGISTTGLNKANLIEEIEYAQQNQQDDYQQ